MCGSVLLEYFSHCGHRLQVKRRRCTSRICTSSSTPYLCVITDDLCPYCEEGDDPPNLEDKRQSLREGFQLKMERTNRLWDEKEIRERKIASEEVLTVNQAKKLVLLYKDMSRDERYMEYRQEAENHCKIFIRAVLKLPIQVYFGEASDNDILLYLNLVTRHLLDTRRPLRDQPYNTMPELEQEIAGIYESLIPRYQMLDDFLQRSTQFYGPEEQSNEALVKNVASFSFARDDFLWWQRKHERIAQRKKAAVASLLTPLPLEELPATERDCDICQNPFDPVMDGETTESDSPAMLPCGHRFGSSCIFSWLMDHFSTPTCPMCRRGFSPELSQAQRVRV